MNQEPLQLGDFVTFVNDQGCEFPGKTIIEIRPEPGNGGRDYFYSPSPSPWFGARRDQLRLEMRGANPWTRWRTSDDARHVLETASMQPTVGVDLDHHALRTITLHGGPR